MSKEKLTTLVLFMMISTMMIPSNQDIGNTSLNQEFEFLGTIGAPVTLSSVAGCTNPALSYTNCDDWLPNAPYSDYYGRHNCDNR